MYDHILSSQWIFDRCLEGSTHFPFFVLLLSFTLATFLVYFISKVYRSSTLILKTRIKDLFFLVVGSVFIFLTAISIIGIVLIGPFDQIGLTVIIPMFLSQDARIALLGLLFLFIVYEFYKYLVEKRINIQHSRRSIIRLLFILVITPLFMPLSVLTLFIGSFGILGCSFNSVWKSVVPGHEIHALMKYQYLEGKGWPKSEEELKSLNKDLYHQISVNAKTRYIYNDAAKSYTWFIRPSNYIVVVFDDSHDYSIYKIPGLVTIDEGLQSYPPNYSGPWDQLPK